MKRLLRAAAGSLTLLGGVILGNLLAMAAHQLIRITRIATQVSGSAETVRTLTAALNRADPAQTNPEQDSAPQHTHPQGTREWNGP